MLSPASLPRWPLTADADQEAAAGEAVWVERGVQAGGLRGGAVLGLGEEAQFVALGKLAHSFGRANQIVKVEDRHSPGDGRHTDPRDLERGLVEDSAWTVPSVKLSGAIQGSTSRTPPGSRCRAMAATAACSRSTATT